VVLLALAIGVAAFALLLVVEARIEYPMLPLHLFRSRSFAGVNIMTLLLYGALSGLFFLFPFNLLQVQGYTTTQAGLATLPFVFVMFFLGRWSGGVVDRFGARPMLIIGPSVVAVACLVFAIPSVGGSYWTTFFPALFLFGI